MPTVFMHYPTDSGCGYHRLLCPARFCSEVFEQQGWEFYVGDGLPQGHDVYVIHGLPVPSTILELGKIKRRGKKFVWSVDDDWLTIPSWNPANPGDNGMAVYEITKRLADFIITSTPVLAETFADVGDRVVCAPNLMDVSLFPPLPQAETVDGKVYYDVKPVIPVRVVWTGGPTHSGDVEVMTDVLDKFLDKYGGDKAVVIYNGSAPHPKLIRKYLHKSLFHQPMVPFASYQQILNSVTPHLYLAPLAKIEFNLSKSNIRVLEGWALGAPVIATDWGEYSCVSKTDGRLVDDPEQWYSALVRLVTDHESRVSMGVHGRLRVEREYDWNNPVCRAPWVKAFSRILGVEP